jgi:exonuclease VII large subunit
LLSKSIELHDIDKTLKKGFALIRQNSKFISRKNNFNLAEPAIIKFYDGEIELK